MYTDEDHLWMCRAQERPTRWCWSRLDAAGFFRLNLIVYNILELIKMNLNAETESDTFRNVQHVIWPM